MLTVSRLCVALEVWQIRVDVHMLDHDGGLLDCASLSAITALAHYRRPDCSVVGHTVIVVSDRILTIPETGLRDIEGCQKSLMVRQNGPCGTGSVNSAR